MAAAWTFLSVLLALASPALGCIAQGAGCAAHLPPCCAGLSCVIAFDIWGFCQPSGNPPPPQTTTTTTTTPSTTTASTTTTSTTTPTTTTSASSALISKAEFIAAVIGARPEYPFQQPTDLQYQNLIAYARSYGNIASKQELAMFLANSLLETDGLIALQEYACSQYVYNNEHGVPGKNYCGRGYIHLSWPQNYREASLALYGSRWLLDYPEVVATDDVVAWETAFWYWSTLVRNQPGVLSGQFGATTKAINGALECGPGASNTLSPKTRFRYYSNIFKVWNLPGLPNEAGCY